MTSTDPARNGSPLAQDRPLAGQADAAQVLHDRFQSGQMSDRFRVGYQFQSRMDPALPETIQATLADVAPDFGRIIVEFVFGDIYARPQLDFKLRVLATLAAVTALNQVFAVEEYVRFALNEGYSRSEVAEVIMQMAVYAGMGPAMEGLAAAQRVFDARDAADHGNDDQADAALAAGSVPVSPRLAAGERLYKALGEGDAAVLRELLDDGFQGHLTAGLPHGFGERVYDGREAMLTEGWGGVGEYFEMSPQVEELLEAGDYVIGRGSYVGVAKPTGKPVKAAFVHFWQFDGDSIVSVHQTTDSALWTRALQS